MLARGRVGHQYRLVSLRLARVTGTLLDACSCSFLQRGHGGGLVVLG